MRQSLRRFTDDAKKLICGVPLRSYACPRIEKASEESNAPSLISVFGSASGELEAVARTEPKAPQDKRSGAQGGTASAPGLG